MKYFSMFSGIEGFGLGLPIEHFSPIGFSEIDKYASQVLKYRFPNVKNYGDCKTIKWEEVADFDLLTGGSPCQDFSIAGKRRGLGGSRSSLAWEFIRCLRIKKPRYFIWENVKGVVSSRGGWDFANIITAFSESGYALWWQVLNAKDFGVPQNRERIFVIGFRNESPKEVFFKQEDNGEIDELRGQPTTNTIKSRYEALGDGSYIIEGKFNAQKENISNTLRSRQGGVYKDKLKIKLKDANSKGYSEAEPFDGIRLQFPDSITARGRVVKQNSQTLQASGAGGVLLPSMKIRKPTPIECERLMSWPDNWTKWGIDKGNKVEISDSQRYKMCGNGVVSNVVRKLVEEILL